MALKHIAMHSIWSLNLNYTIRIHIVCRIGIHYMQLEIIFDIKQDHWLHIYDSVQGKCFRFW